MDELFKCGNGLAFPRGGWRFNRDVAEVFHDHVNMSIPGYSLVHRYISEICSSQVINGKTLRVLDLGCSIGELEKRIIEDNNIDISIDAVDNSVDMLKSPDLFVDDRVYYTCQDIVDYVESCSKKYDIVTVLYVLQFLSENRRERLIQKLERVISDDTTLIFADKFVTTNAFVDNLNEGLLRDFKRQSGFTREEIRGKRESLAGVQLRIQDGVQDRIAQQLKFGTVELLDSSLNFKCYMMKK